MDKETWMKKLTEELHRRLGTEYHLEPKTRGDDAVMEIQKEGDLSGIALNLSVCLPVWLYREEKIREAAEVLVNEYRQKCESLLGDALSGKSFEKAKHMVVYVLERQRGNEEALSHIPYEEFFGMVLIFELHMYRGTENFRRVINNEDMRQWGVGKEELLEAARQNTPLLYPPVIGLLEFDDSQRDRSEPKPVEILELFSQMSADEKVRLFILTSINGQYGAGCIFYEDVLKQIAGACQDDLVIFPTSPCEVLLFPSQRDCWRMEEWMQIVSEMERTREFGDWSFLDGFYLYDRAEDTIRPILGAGNQAGSLAS